MSVDEELHEHAEHAKEPFDKKVAVTMAVIAAVIAVVGVLGHYYTTEELLAQQQASDQWAYYQAKSIRRYTSEVAKDLFANAKAEADIAKYEKNVTKYEEEGKEIQKKATELEDESHLNGKKALRFHIAEVFLEIGIVLASLAILSKRKLAWQGSMLSAGIGIVLALSSALIA